MTVGTFKGRIAPINLTEILKFLRESAKSGVLRTETDGESRSLYVRRGRVIAGESSLPDESIIEMARAAGRVDPELGSTCKALVKGGIRPGRALVESGALRPEELHDWTERHVRCLARAMISSPSGAFAFEEGAMPPVAWMLVDLDILQVILESVRQLETDTLLATHLPEQNAVLEHFTYSDGGEAPPLLPHEKYVLSLVNSSRTVEEIARISELGERATRKVLCLMFLVGCVRHRRDETVEGAPLPTESATKDFRAVIRAYNEMFAFIYGYMIKEVGPIAEHVLEKYLREVRDVNQPLFSRITLSKEGTLDEDALARNIQLLRGKSGMDLLVRGLNEFLYSGQLAVKRTLGVDHEAIVIRRLSEIRKMPATLG